MLEELKICYTLKRMESRGTLANSVETVREEIASKLARAQEIARDTEELTDLQEQKVRMLNQTPADFLKNIDAFESLDNELQSHIVTVSTLPEFKILLEETGANTETILDSLAHENAHMNEAEAWGFKTKGYSLLISKNENGYAYTPIANYEVPKSLNTESETIANIAIAKAPAEYGNRLAPDDIERIAELKRQLTDLY